MGIGPQMGVKRGYKGKKGKRKRVLMRESGMIHGWGGMERHEWDNGGSSAWRRRREWAGMGQGQGELELWKGEMEVRKGEAEEVVIMDVYAGGIGKAKWIREARAVREVVAGGTKWDGKVREVVRRKQVDWRFELGDRIWNEGGIKGAVRADDWEYRRNRINMVNSKEYPEGAKVVALEKEERRGMMEVEEVRWIVWKVGLVGGNYLELGCNQGWLLREVAKAWPEKECYGVDWVGAGVEERMPEEQRHERPKSEEEMGCAARGLENVILENVDSHKFDYSGKDIGVIVIDADHSLAGVAGDTANAIRNWVDRGMRPMSIIWHDYYVRGEDREWPWMACTRFLRCTAGLQLKHVRGTKLCWLDLSVDMEKAASMRVYEVGDEEEMA